jgi:hypothetical protein
MRQEEMKRERPMEIDRRGVKGDREEETEIET